MKPFRTFFASIALAFAVLAAPFVPHSPIGDLAPQTQAQALADHAENKLVDAVFRAQSLGAPSSFYAALLTSSCSDSAGGTEVSGGSYARVEIESGLTTWAATQGGTSASSGTGGVTSNLAAITFPAPTANWGSIVGFKLMSASSDGDMWICEDLTTPKTVNNGDAAPSFAIGALTVTFQ